ncbi:unnamed protein product [Parascedosporium putredinis]|uniref:Uncharacterized protein n=1 Tax=Parascedosporium putredinis TaxID=1442378 RepID=A0A9P1H342_9PEZI|nr:unnamed protein product [Parascedosporium putredinis]CAI7994302.1 unnamed protein product [Parascedosporium putredinis]
MSLSASRLRLSRLALSNPHHLPSVYIAGIPSSTRAITSTAQQCSLPPESPAYIPVPVPPLSDETKPTRVRGSLPVPRKVFPQPSDSRKLDPSYLAETYPRSEKPQPPATLIEDHPQHWKRIMADSRRKNLRAGLQGLWRRKLKRDERDASLGADKHKAHMAAGLAAERTDEFLTLSTILQETLNTEVLPDPDRFQKAEVSRKRTLELEEERRDARLHSLMELYVNANHFIVDEKDLEVEVDHLFSENYWRAPSKNSAWQEWGSQSGVNDMVGQTVRESAPTLDNYTAGYTRNMKRQKKVAEELTGGKME